MGRPAVAAVYLVLWLARDDPAVIDRRYNRTACCRRRSCSVMLAVLLLILLAASGCAALIYEIVWLQLLQLVIGSSAVSLGLLLAAYMGGLCLGSAALPRFVSPNRNPLRVYAYLELG